MKYRYYAVLEVRFSYIIPEDESVKAVGRVAMALIQTRFVPVYIIMWHVYVLKPLKCNSGLKWYQLSMYVCAYESQCDRACVYVHQFVGSLPSTKVFMGNLPATERGCTI